MAEAPKWAVVVTAISTGIGAAIAVGALVVSVLSMNESRRAAAQALDSLQVAEEALVLAQREDVRAETASVEEVAREVELGEATPSAYARVGNPDGGGRWEAVLNRHGSEITDVWVEDGRARAVVIEGVQGCTQYLLPPDFTASVLFFTDRAGRRWTIPAESRAPVPNTDPATIPERDQGLVSPFTLPIEACPG